MHIDLKKESDTTDEQRMMTFKQFIIEAPEWFHGTSRYFHTPDVKGAGYLRSFGRHGSGFYLTADPKEASSYADHRSKSKSKDYGAQKGIGPNVQPYKVLPHKTFDREKTYSPQEVQNIVSKISDVIGYAIPKKFYKNGILSGNPVKGFVILLALADMHPEKDANFLIHKAGYDSISGLHGDNRTKELAILNPDVIKPYYMAEESNYYEPGKWGFIDHNGKLVGPKKGETTHGELARNMGFRGKDSASIYMATSKGYVRYRP